MLVNPLVSCMRPYFFCGKLSVIVQQTPCIPMRIDDAEYVVPSKALGSIGYAFHEDS